MVTLLCCLEFHDEFRPDIDIYGIRKSILFGSQNIENCCLSVLLFFSLSFFFYILFLLVVLKSLLLLGIHFFQLIRSHDGPSKKRMFCNRKRAIQSPLMPCVAC